jgi:hypothetical protein
VKLERKTDGKAKALFALDVLVQIVHLDHIFPIIFLFFVVDSKAISEELLVCGVCCVVLRNHVRS